MVVLPVHVRAAADALRGTDVKVVALVSFPFGADVPAVKLAAAQAAAEAGAGEVEVVMGMAAFLGGELPAVRDELRGIVRAFRLRGGRSVGVRGVVETAYLDDSRIRLAAKVMTAAGVDAVVTSTGLAPRGAIALDVELLRGELDPRIAIKAVGGIRTVDEAADLLAAGAGRLGTTSAAASTTARSGAREDDRTRDGVASGATSYEGVSRARAERSEALVDRSEATAGARRERSAAAVMRRGAVIDGRRDRS